MSTVTDINVITGQVTIREMTPQEIAARDARIAEQNAQLLQPQQPTE